MKVFGAFVVLAALSLAAPAESQPPVWIVRDRDSTMTLFGSVHALPRGLDWSSDALDRAIVKADDLWFELPIDDASTTALQRESSARGFLPKGRRLSTMLSRGGRVRLIKVTRALGLAADQLDRMDPWYAELTLGSAIYALSGASSADGAERRLAAAAPAAARRRAFETPAQQIALFDSAPVRDQIASLEQTLRQIERSPGDYDGLVRAWMAGDVRAIDRQALAPLRQVAPRLYARLVTDRNARWTQVLAGRMKGSGRTVVVVGVGHLVGSDGIPARLRALGYVVEGPR